MRERWLDIASPARYHLCKIFMLTSILYYGIAYGIHLEIKYNFVKINHEKGLKWNVMFYVTILVGMIYPFWSTITKHSNIILIIIMPIVSGIVSGIVLVALCSALLTLDINEQMVQDSKFVNILQTVPLLFGILFNIFMFMIFVTAKRKIYYAASFVVYFSIIIMRPSELFIAYLILCIVFFLITIAPTQTLLYPIKKYDDKYYGKLDYVKDTRNFTVDMLLNRTNSKYWRGDKKKR
eukprot:5688_1